MSIATQACARGISVSDDEEKEEEQSPSKVVKKEKKLVIKVCISTITLTSKDMGTLCHMMIVAFVCL